MQDEHEMIPVLASATSSLQLSQTLVLIDLVPCAAGCRGGGKVGILFLDFHFSTVHISSPSPGFLDSRWKQPGLWECGNLAARARFPRSCGKGGNPAFGFPGFPSLRHFHSALLGPVLNPLPSLS